MGVLWTLNEIEPATFRQLQESCETISPSVLNKRLAELRVAQLITRGDEGYATTPLGRELHAHLTPLGAWAKTWATALPDPADAPLE